MNDRAITEELYKLLEGSGYPRQSLHIGYCVRGEPVNLAVLDPSTEFPLLLFKINYTQDEKSAETSQSQLEVFMRAQINAEKRRVNEQREKAQYEFFLKLFKTHVIFFRYNKNKEIEFSELARTLSGVPALFPLSGLPTFKGLRGRLQYAPVMDAMEEKEENLNKFKKRAELLATAILALLLLNYLNGYTLSLERIYMIILLIILSVAPFIVGVKFAGFEMQFLTQAQKRKAIHEQEKE